MTHDVWLRTPFRNLILPWQKSECYQQSSCMNTLKMSSLPEHPKICHSSEGWNPVNLSTHHISGCESTRIKPSGFLEPTEHSERRRAVIFLTKGVEHDKRNPPLHINNKLFGDQTTQASWQHVLLNLPTVLFLSRIGITIFVSLWIPAFAGMTCWGVSQIGTIVAINYQLSS